MSIIIQHTGISCYFTNILHVWKMIPCFFQQLSSYGNLCIFPFINKTTGYFQYWLFYRMTVLFYQYNFIIFCNGQCTYTGWQFHHKIFRNDGAIRHFTNIFSRSKILML